MKKIVTIVFTAILCLLALSACGNYAPDYLREYDYYGDYLRDAGIPDAFAVVDELIGQGYSSDVDELRRMVDDIGYYPSVLFGNYIADSDRVVHLTDGPCFDGIASEDLIPIGPFADLNAVKKEIADNDGYLDGYSVCDKCCH